MSKAELKRRVEERIARERKLSADVAEMFRPVAPSRYLWRERWGRDGASYSK